MTCCRTSRAPPEPIARTLSTMYKGGPWPTRLRIQRLAEQISGDYEDANTFVGDLHSERPSYVATITQNLSEPDQQTRDEAPELLARLQGSPELVRALDQAGEQGRPSPSERPKVLWRALSHPISACPCASSGGLSGTASGLSRVIRGSEAARPPVRTAPADTRSNKGLGQARRRVEGRPSRGAGIPLCHLRDHERTVVSSV